MVPRNGPHRLPDAGPLPDPLGVPPKAIQANKAPVPSIVSTPSSKFTFAVLWDPESGLSRWSTRKVVKEARNMTLDLHNCHSIIEIGREEQGPHE